MPQGVLRWMTEWIEKNVESRGRSWIWGTTSEFVCKNSWKWWNISVNYYRTPDRDLEPVPPKNEEILAPTQLRLPVSSPSLWKQDQGWQSANFVKGTATNGTALRNVAACPTNNNTIRTVNRFTPIRLKHYHGEGEADQLGEDTQSTRF